MKPDESDQEASPSKRERKGDDDVGLVAIKTTFLEIFPDAPDFEISRSTNLKSRSSKSHNIYPLNHLQTLLQSEASLVRPPDRFEFEDDKQALRFLVDVNKTIWFAQEIGGPAHYRMTRKPQKEACCLTAGDVFFSGDYRQLVKINNKSGDFHPPFASIQLLLAILIFNEDKLPFSLPQQLRLEKFEGSKPTCVYLLDWAEVRAEIKKRFGHGAEYQNQTDEIKKTEIESRVGRPSVGGSFAQPRSLDLGGSDSDTEQKVNHAPISLFNRLAQTPQQKPKKLIFC